MSLLLPSQLVAEATSVAADDLMVVQVTGEKRLRKIKPAVLTNGITALGGTPQALGAVANGTSTAVARADHVHPTTGVMTTSHAANEVTGWGSTPAALGAAATGSATTVARGDHVHPFSGGSSTVAFATAELTTEGIRPRNTAYNTVGTTGQRYYRGWFSELYDDDGVVSTSDERQKIDIEDSDLGLGFIQALRPISYRRRWRGKEEDGMGQGVRRHYGLSAQQCKSVLGEKDFAGYVDIDQTGEELGLRYSEFIAPLIRAVQELAEEVAVLSSKLKDAEAKVLGNTGV